jgi:hypothetical protein
MVAVLIGCHMSYIGGESRAFRYHIYIEKAELSDGSSVDRLSYVIYRGRKQSFRTTRPLTVYRDLHIYIEKAELSTG